MRLTRRTRLGELLEAHPDAESVFADNDIEVEDVDREATLGSIARQYELDVADLLAELRDEIDDDLDYEDGFGGEDEEEEEDEEGGEDDDYVGEEDDLEVGDLGGDDDDLGGDDDLDDEDGEEGEDGEGGDGGDDGDDDF